MSEDYPTNADFPIHCAEMGDFALEAEHQRFYRESKVCKHPDCDRRIMDKSTVCRHHKWWWIEMEPRFCPLWERYLGLETRLAEGEDVRQEIIWTK